MVEIAGLLQAKVPGGWQATTPRMLQYLSTTSQRHWIPTLWSRLDDSTRGCHGPMVRGSTCAYVVADYQETYAGLHRPFYSRLRSRWYRHTSCC